MAFGAPLPEAVITNVVVPAWSAALLDWYDSVATAADNYTCTVAAGGARGGRLRQAACGQRAAADCLPARCLPASASEGMTSLATLLVLVNAQSTVVNGVRAAHRYAPC